MTLRFSRFVLGFGCWLVSYAAIAQALPPPPDSLRAVLAASPAGAARFRALLRVAGAFTDAVDPAAEAYAVAAERLYRLRRHPAGSARRRRTGCRGKARGRQAGAAGCRLPR